MKILCIIIAIVAIIIAIYCAISKKKIDTIAEEKNKQIYAENEKLEKLNIEIKNILNNTTKENQNMLYENSQLEIKIKERKEHLSTIQSSINEAFENQTSLSEKAYENFWQVLDTKYKETEEEYNELKNALENSYSNLQLELMRETNGYREELEKMRATHAAAIEAERREKLIEDNLSAYCLILTESDKLDISKLESLKPSLNKPRVLSMLIWQTWFQKPLKSLSSTIVGTEDKTGIYKITNIKTKECYIGQAVDISKRWQEHVKCGLGIDTPAGNKLYKAMSEYGMWNFSFEVLEECSREQLNEKERYYISLYNSYEFGYNSNRGNK